MSKKPDGKKKSSKSGDKPAVAPKPKGMKPDYTPKAARDVSPEVRIALTYSQCCTLPGKLAGGIVGHYGIKTESGTVILEVRPHGDKSVIYVTDSTMAGITPHEYYFIPVSTLRHENLQQVTEGTLFAWQQKVHAFLRKHVACFYPKKAALNPDVANCATKVLGEAEAVLEAGKKASRPLTEADKRAIESAVKRRKAKLGKKRAAQKTAQIEAMILAHMFKNCVSPMEIVHGHLGYCDLSSKSGELIVNFYLDGADRKVHIEHMSENHMLRLAGIPLMYSVFASAVQNGRIDEVSRQLMTSEDYRKRSILAKHIQQQMEERGIRFKKNEPVSH